MEVTEAILASILMAALLLTVLGMPIGTVSLHAVLAGSGGQNKVADACRCYLPCAESSGVFHTRTAQSTYHIQHIGPHPRLHHYLSISMTLKATLQHLKAYTGL